MKKMSMMCITVACLAMQGLSSRLSMESGLIYLKRHHKDYFENRRAEYNNPEKLREHLVGDLPDNPNELFVKRNLRGFTGKEKAAFKRVFELNEETVRTTLMAIIREAAVETEWKKDKSTDAENRMSVAMAWLGFYADAEAKQFLMDVFKDRAKGDGFRRAAIGSYLHSANVQETKDALAYLLTDEMQPLFDEPGLICFLAMDVYVTIEDDTKKREAIVTAVSTALAKESDTQKREEIIASMLYILAQEGDKETFAEADKLLSARSKEYADSPQRKAALERMNIPIEKGEQ